ncbi:unnamed protein product [Polarella glacialis]|uniref:Uncharacterized protein n=1 Tax=Polarella glacialis TaxID=89957 RepID=A0A813LD49_POLGL|nr:unnamed protein product [Polarella glacialis]
MAADTPRRAADEEKLKRPKENVVSKKSPQEVLTSKAAKPLFTRGYCPGHWDIPGLSLPSLTRAQDNEQSVSFFREKVIQSDLTTVRTLLQSGFPVTHPLSPRRSRSALHLAAEAGDIAMVHLLLSFRADPAQPAKMNTNARIGLSMQGRTPLDVARVREHYEIVHLLSMHLPAPPLVDVGPTPPVRQEFPLRLQLRANEAGLVGAREVLKSVEARQKPPSIWQSRDPLTIVDP